MLYAPGFLIGDSHKSANNKNNTVCMAFKIRNFLCQVRILYRTSQLFRMTTAVADVSICLKRDAADLEVEDEEEAKKQKLETPLPNGTETKLRVKMKKMAMMLSYSGKDYWGMQKNPGVKTIEGELLPALVRVGLIQQEHFDCPQSMGFQRAARTDKGVSAVRQVVSIKLPVDKNLEEAVNSINSELPPEIRVMGIKRSTRGFNSKNNCDARTYSYMLPTFAFAPLETLVTEEYRITDSVLQGVNNFLSKYVGTYSYYNFTSGREANDASCKRYIMSAQCGNPFMRDGLEFVVVTIKGQSFMLHQIRKMVGLAIAVMRGLADEKTLYKARELARLDLPKAPGLGLMLEDIHYEQYNKRYGGDGIHEILGWEEHQQKVQKFKEDFIYPTIVQTEKEEKSMMEWMSTLAHHSYDVRDRTITTHDSITNNSMLFGAGIKVEGLEKKEKTESKTCD